MNTVPTYGELLEALEGVTDYNFTMYGRETNTGDPSSLYNRVKRARAIVARARRIDRKGGA